MPEYSEADLRLIADVARFVYGWGLEYPGRGYREDGSAYLWPYHETETGLMCVPDFLGDDAAALGMLDKLAADGRIVMSVLTDYTVRDSDRLRCRLRIGICRRVDGWGPTLPRAIVLAVDAMLKEEERNA